MTQMIDAKNNVITEEMKYVARREGIDPDKIRKLVSKGYVVIPKNIHRATNPVGIGDNLRTKINVNIGTSPDCVDIELEIRKTKVANKYGADAIMDLSTGGDLSEIRKKIMENTDLPIGTVPIYEMGVISKKKYGSIIDMDEDIMFNTIEKQAKEGVDFMTLHCGITRNSVESLKKEDRIMGIVSRGGSFLAAYIVHHNKENPLYSQFDYLLEILKEHDVTLSLGDGMRPGCLCDNTDRPQIQELIILGELVDRCREIGVQVMVEGPGHVPLNNIEANIRIQKSICKNAPFYVLGPIVTDMAPGYDHITSAIGGAIAGYAGANFLCYVTPAEHVRLMNEEDVKEGIIAAKIAAQAADVAKGNKIAWEMEKEMAIARKNHLWDKQFQLAFDKEKPKRMREELPSSNEKACSVCGDLCALLIAENIKKDNCKKIK
ncbi:MAG TPA: phosphomethylpyrimidine synthase [Methanothermococcus okinawensis]|uniref:Phosphomethylpyrimidine synthase n=1 Tax=Methanothermococcus okinawensis TaxID=155863 RepID=A0A833DQ69_9EURY|nr:phosphomethylpyrimidine synthase [Methanothermococcus okinawensis]